MLAGTIGAAIIVGVLGLPLTAITWCGPGEPRTYRKTNLVGVPLHKQNFFIMENVGSKLGLGRSDECFVHDKKN